MFYFLSTDQSSATIFISTPSTHSEGGEGLADI